MNKLILEYIWLDGYKTPNLRSKIKVVDWLPKEEVTIENLPLWNFDGSSTNQAVSFDSECVLKPVRVYPSPDSYLYFVFCEVLDKSMKPHQTNFRSRLSALKPIYKQEEFWFGFEQEYFITDNRRPLGFPEQGFPPPQGFYYCGNGAGQADGRAIAEKHMRNCLHMGIGITGINAEVAIGQWEYQCFAKDALQACDDLWMSRFLLYRIAEANGFGIDLNPKPIQGDWNGSGCHTNFSTQWMREDSNKDKIVCVMDSLSEMHEEHIACYGENNDQRLTGLHETQAINKFSWGVADRGASIRVPYSVYQNQWNGYLEDRRPASNCDPYRVAQIIIETVNGSQI